MPNATDNTTENSTETTGKDKVYYSSQFPADLHADLTEIAKDYGLSLNKFIHSVLRQDVIDFKAGKRKLTLQPLKKQDT